MYAKIKDAAVVKFPYLFEDLFADNPNTLYDNRFILPEWFAMTEDATKNGCSLVEVTEQDAPSLGPEQYLKKKEVPEFIGGKWVIGWEVKTHTPAGPIPVQQPQEEI